MVVLHRRCFLALIDTLAKHMMMMRDAFFHELVTFLEVQYIRISIHPSTYLSIHELVTFLEALRPCIACRL